LPSWHCGDFLDIGSDRPGKHTIRPPRQRAGGQSEMEDPAKAARKKLHHRYTKFFWL
jgi:hypothetical protein